MLLEPELCDVLEALGLHAPAHVVLPADVDVYDAGRTIATSLTSARVVLKVLSDDIVHKTDVGGVETVPRDTVELTDALERMRRALGERSVRGWSAHEHVEHDAGLGGELLLGMRYAEDFGPIVTLGAGGLAAEHLGRNLRAERGMVILSPAHPPRAQLSTLLASKAIPPLVTGQVRGHAARLPVEQLVALLERLLQLAEQWCPSPFAELEINPLVFSARGPTALDAWAKLGGPVSADMPPRPMDKVASMLAPRSIAVAGVSSHDNPGRLIVQNCLRDGFDPERLWIVKPGASEIDGCTCVENLRSLPSAVDLLVVSIPAADAVDLVEEAIRDRRARGVLIIPGGIGERAGTQPLQERLTDAIRRARAAEDRGPAVVGANCMGIRSRPGHYDTTFLPHHKMPRGTGPAAPLALVSQSGAFAAAMSGRLQPLAPRYLITVGNQVDVTLGDVLQHLESDPELRVYACHVEGFRPLDGHRWLDAAARLVAAGRAVVLHRSGRTKAGARASASHTAALAGDYEVTRELCDAAGVLVAETLDDFEGLTDLCCRLASRSVGPRLGALSNAGYECVEIADHAGALGLDPWSEPAAAALEEALRTHHLNAVVGVGNPVDVTPMMGDAAFVETARRIVADPDVGVALVGCVPMTGALATLPPSTAYEESLEAPSSVVTGLARLWAENDKAWVCVVDGGAAYEPMALALRRAGIPTFRSADTAARLLGRYVRWRLAGAQDSMERQ